MSDIVSLLKKNNPDLKKPEIEGILYLLVKYYEDGVKIANNELITQTGLPKEILRIFKQSINTYLKEPSGDQINLSENGYKTLKPINPKPFKWSLINYEVWELEQKFEQIRKKYNLEPKREYDQFFATNQTSLYKAKIMTEKGVTKGKRIALIGDDDLLSICLGLIDSQASNITVFDIDQDILNTITKIAKDLGLTNIQTELYDARKEINPNFIGRFDVIATDPPYTKQGVELFLNRSLELLSTADYEGKYIFIHYGNSFKSPEKFIKIQEIINKYNLTIEDKIDKFARYKGAESIGSASSLYILKTTKSSGAISKDLMSTKIYTFEDQSEEKFPFVDHVVIKVNGVNQQVLKSKSSLQKLFGEFCKVHRLKVVDNKITQFSKGGLSITYILANSNLVIHTWAEYSALHIDLITCSPIYKKELIPQTLSNLFKTKQISINLVD